MPHAPRRRIWDRVAHRLSPFVFRRDAQICSGGIVSFTFDDFPRSAYRCGGAILSSHGMQGTYYACFDLAGRADETGEFFLTSDVDPLMREGHELASHTFSHRSQLLHGPATIRWELERNDIACRELAPGVALRNFAYPYGLVSPLFKLNAGRRFASARGTRPGINLGTIDLNDLKASPLYATTSPSDVAAIIAENARQGGWLIFVTHEVCDAPSKFGCTPRQFEAAVKATKAAGSPVLTIDNALRCLTTASGGPVGRDQ